jgi:hypothetical protein
MKKKQNKKIRYPKRLIMIILAGLLLIILTALIAPNFAAKYQLSVMENSSRLSATASGPAITGITPSNDAVYTLVGSAGSETLTVTAGTLTFTQDMASVGHAGLTVITNGGNVAFASTEHLKSVTINQGVSTIPLHGSRVLFATSLTINTAQKAALDIFNNAVVVDYSGNPNSFPTIFATIKGYLLSGKTGDTWTGSGIRSSVATLDKGFSLGLGDNATMPLGAQSMFVNQTIPTNAILVRFTSMGDTDLDGKVGDNDVTVIGAGYDNGKTKNYLWQDGDLNYDGLINDDDVTLQGGFYNEAGSATNLIATTSGTAVILSWNDPSTIFQEPGFTIERKTTGNYTTLANVGQNVTTYTDTTAAAGTSYSYRVKASGSAYTSYSNEEMIAVASPIPAPAPPVGLPAIIKTSSDLTITHPAPFTLNVHGLYGHDDLLANISSKGCWTTGKSITNAWRCEYDVIDDYNRTALLSVGSPAFSTFEWDFGDPNGKYNKLRGFNSAHTYDVPGTYTVKLTVTNPNGTTGTKLVTVIVGQDTRKNVYIDAVNGNDANDGSLNAPVRTVVGANRIGTGGTNVLFKRGQTHTISSTLYIGVNGVVGAYGSGANPVLFTTLLGPNAVLDTSYGKDLIIQDITIDATPTATLGRNLATGIALGGTNITIRRVNFKTIGNAMNANLNPKEAFIVDNTELYGAGTYPFPGLESYFLWMQGTDITIVGNTVLNSQRQHIVRGYSWERVSMSYNSFSNPNNPNEKYTDASGSVVYPDYLNSAVNLQPGHYAYVGNNLFRDAVENTGPLGAQDGVTRQVQFERNYMLNTISFSKFFIAQGAEGLLVRDNIMYDTINDVQIEATLTDPQNRKNSNVVFQNNTGVNNQSYGKFMSINNSSVGMNLSNNLYIAPLLKGGAYDSAAIGDYGTDLSMFGNISNNYWPLASGVPGPHFINYAYQSPSAWASFPVVKSDIFRTSLPAPLTGAPYTSFQFIENGITYGVRYLVGP